MEIYLELFSKFNKIVNMKNINLHIIPITLLAQLASAASHPAPYPCPDFNNSSYTDTTGSNYHIQCSTDYSGNDLPAVHTDTFEECLKACDTYVPGSSAEAHNYAACMGVSWGAENPGGNCYLKYQITNINANNVGVSSGFYANKTLSGSAAVTSSGGGSTSSTTSAAPISSSTKAATSAILPTPSGGGSDSHVRIGVGVGVGIGAGVLVALAILAGFFYRMRMRRRSNKGRPVVVPVEMDAEGDNKKIDRAYVPSSSERRIDELWTENTSAELSVFPHGLRAELT